GRPRLADVDSRCLLYRCRIAAFQHSADLSPGWRPDPPVATVVCARARAQFDGGHSPWIRRRSCIHRPCGLVARCMARRNRGLHAAELLGRTATRAGAVTFRKIAAPGWVCLSIMQIRAADRRVLEVRALWATLRHLPDSGRLSPLCDAVCGDEVLGLRRSAPHERMGYARNQRKFDVRK